MKVTITLNKQTFHRDIPISWDQVTFGDFLKLDACGQDVIKVIAMLTRVDYEQLKKAHIKNLDGVIATLGFLNKPMVPADYQSIKSLYGYPLPKGLEFEETQMYLDLKDEIGKDQALTPIQQLEKYTLYCAVYACKHFYGEYGWEHALKLAPVFLNAPCTEVVAVGNFTLMRLIGLNLGIATDSLNQVSRIKKFRLVLKALVIRTGYYLRSRILRKGLA